MMKNRKNGVAVIIVLGILALLMILAISFSISMRVERAGVANFASAVRARQLVWAGLASAIGKINETTPDMYPVGDCLPSGPSTWDPTNSLGSAVVKLLKGSARDYVPGGLAAAYGDQASAWQSVDTGKGSFAYLVLNISDLLDANYVGGAARQGGTNATELVLDSIGLSSNEVADMVVERQSGGPFLSIPQFEARTDLTNDYLVTYSRYIPDSDCTNAVYIGGAESDLIDNEDEIVDAIRDMAESGGQGQLSLANGRAVFTNLLDYIDADSEPKTLMGPNSEAVPMLNEVAPIAAQIQTESPNNYQFTAYIGVETWYPFVQPSTENFELSCQYSVSATITQMVNGVVSSSSGTLNPISTQIQDEPIDLTGPFNVEVMGIAVDIPFDPASSNRTFGIAITVSNLVVELAGSDTVVDTVNGGVFAFNYNGPEGLNLDLSPASHQTIDPRFNWDQSVYHWVSSTTFPLFPGVSNAPTLYWPGPPLNNDDGTNVWTKAFLQLNNPALQPDRGGAMHVSNAGRLYSALELGNLLRSNQDQSILQTFRVFGDSTPGGINRHAILENFTTFSTNAPSRGLVNANTPSIDVDVLKTAFSDMPHPYVGGPALSGTTLDQVTNMINTAQAAGTVFSSMTDLLEPELDWEGTFPDLSDVELEALAAYSMGLMGVRQNLFLILVSATTAVDLDAVQFFGRQNAVVWVWRDPVPNAQGLHDCFVRQFKWLD